jgi:U4/U6.U5 tri-snRNP component SNU23
LLQNWFCFFIAISEKNETVEQFNAQPVTLFCENKFCKFTLERFKHFGMAGIRRTWDKEFFAKKAKERSEQGDDFESESNSASKTKKFIKEEFQAAEDGAAGPMGSQRAFIKSRDTRIDLDTKVGKTELINPTSAESSRGAGFWCEVCSCLLKDSASYLDHINGKKRMNVFWK